MALLRTTLTLSAQGHAETDDSIQFITELILLFHGYRIAHSLALCFICRNRQIKRLAISWAIWFRRPRSDQLRHGGLVRPTSKRDKTRPYPTDRAKKQHMRNQNNTLRKEIMTHLPENSPTTEKRSTHTRTRSEATGCRSCGARRQRCERAPAGCCWALAAG